MALFYNSLFSLNMIQLLRFSAYKDLIYSKSMQFLLATSRPLLIESYHIYFWRYLRECESHFFATLLTIDAGRVSTSCLVIQSSVKLRFRKKIKSSWCGRGLIDSFIVASQTQPPAACQHKSVSGCPCLELCSTFKAYDKKYNCRWGHKLNVSGHNKLATLRRYSYYFVFKDTNTHER